MKELAAEAIVSVETDQPEVVRACLDAGAGALNMTLPGDEDDMLALAAENDAAVVMRLGITVNVREIADVPPDADPMLVPLDRLRTWSARPAPSACKVVVEPDGP